jgi:hypothetical protein
MSENNDRDRRKCTEFALIGWAADKSPSYNGLRNENDLNIPTIRCLHFFFK